MKEKIKQKGFVQIPLLVVAIASAILVLLGTGVVLEKQGKLTPYIASISEAFKKEAGKQPQEEQKIEQKEGQVSPTEIVNPSEIRQEDISQQESEKVKLEAEKEKLRTEIEKVKAEAEKAKAEIEVEKNKFEMERLRTEQEAKVSTEKNQQAEVQKFIEEQKRDQELKNQQQLKIEKCEAATQAKIDQYKTKFSIQCLESQKNIRQQWTEAISSYKSLYGNCITNMALPGSSPEIQRSMREACYNYLNRATELELELSQKQIESQRICDMGMKMFDQQYNGEYLKCLNNL